MCELRARRTQLTEWHARLDLNHFHKSLLEYLLGTEKQEGCQNRRTCRDNFRPFTFLALERKVLTFITTDVLQFIVRLAFNGDKTHAAQ